jgi:hypothetical protein
VIAWTLPRAPDGYWYALRDGKAYVSANRLDWTSLEQFTAHRLWMRKRRARVPLETRP